MKSILKLLMMLALLTPSVSLACDLCGCYVPGDVVIKGFRFGVAEQFSDFTTLQFDGVKVPNVDDQYLNSWNTQLYANYHFNEKFALQLNIPVLYKSFQRPENGEIQDGINSGFGDVSLIGYYVPYQRKDPYSEVSLKVIGGIKFPTGNSDAIGEELTEGDEGEPSLEVPSGIHGHDIALGTGSYDGLIGMSLFGRVTRAFYTANVQYAIRTHGAFDYKYANDLIWFGGPGYYVAAKQNYSLGLQALLSGEYKGEDELGDEKTDDTAITAVYLGPDALLSFGQGFQAEIGVGFPLLINNSGFQSVPTSPHCGATVRRSW